MKRVSRIGFAGLPGVVLDPHDIRQLSVAFAKEEAASGALNGLSGAETMGATLNDKIASRVFRELGAKELSEAVLKPQQSILLERAGIASASVAHVLKFRTDRVAVLGSMTSPMFARAVEKTKKSLHGLREPDRTLGALTFNFLRGVMDDKAKRSTFYSTAYRKVVRDLASAFQGLSDPKERAKAQPILAKLGVESLETALSGLGLGLAKVPTAWANTKNPYTIPNDVVLPVYKPDTLPTYTQRTARDYGVATKPEKPNVGSLYETPFPKNPKVNTVPTYGTLNALWDMLIHPLQKTHRAWKGTARDTRTVPQVYAEVKARAEKILKAGTDNNAERTAAWITYHWGGLSFFWPNAGIDEATWDRYSKILIGAAGNQPKPYETEGKTWYAFKRGGFAYPLNSYIYPKNLGLFGETEKGNFAGVTSMMFAQHAVIAYYAATELTGDQIRAALLASLKERRPFPWVVGHLLALARWDALYRAGLVGKYDGFMWVPDKSGAELVPQGTEIYADWWSQAGPEKIPLRFDTLPFVTATYRDGYGIEPTRHAIGWYGRMGFGLGKEWYDLAPDDRAKYKNAIISVTPSSDLPRRPDDLRVAGTDIPAESAKDRSNWFAVLGSKITGLMSAVLEAMQAGLRVAKDILCKVFKWMFGSTVGGAICSVLSVLLDFLVGSVIGATAGLFALARGIIGFLDYTVKGDVFGAFKSLFLGVTQSIFFAMGGPIATIAGMPMLKSEEARLRQEAQAAGKNPDDVYPSLERLSEALSDEDPFFIITLIIAVVGLALAGAGGVAAVRKAGGEVVLALCPVVGVFMAPMAMKWIQQSKSDNEWIQKSKAFTQPQIQKAITQICKVLCYVVIGVLRMQDAFKIIRDKWSAYVTKKGGTGKAVMATVGFFAKKLGAELALFFGALIAAASNGFKSGSPAMQVLSMSAEKLFKLLPGVIIAFASEELEVAGKELEEFSAAVNDSFKMIEKAKEEAKVVLEMYDTQLEPPPPEQETEKVAEKKKKKEKPPPPPKKESRSKALLPVLGVAAGLAVGFMLFGGGDGA